jgi:hypothetical protein
MKRNVLLIVVLVPIIFCLWYFLTTRNPEKTDQGTLFESEKPATASSKTSGEPQIHDRSSAHPMISPEPATLSATNMAASNPEQLWLSLYDHPISFYGRVVDEIGHAIPEAVVRFSVADKPWESNVHHDRLTDSNGLVYLTGVRGASLGIRASKEGYYSPEQGSITVHYDHRLRERIFVPIPTSEAPAILILKRKGTPETLVHLTSRSFPVGKDGTPLEINLAASGMTPNALRLEAWIFDQKTNAAGQYDWRCSLSIPGGGFVERKGLFEFEAPAEGYQEYFELAVFANAQGWRRSLQKEFFVRFSDNRFARVSLVLFTRGNPALRIESFLNPTPGSRNLEEDPTKLIEIPKSAQPAP